ncbi:PAS domain S-box protein [Halomicroarcula limicola]|uniref:PAS domain S-box protein n=1 Tax=Haloarcula limicola TaxID=1429915 RepID=A0A8J7YC88_9EURY|nr:bacterio-opsin activator domain-containing protein [Halomicroarcula limicola]MBV0923828.1 PAS domain S-box protein [Halomicroarcula limicola]
MEKSVSDSADVAGKESEETGRETPAALLTTLVTRVPEPAFVLDGGATVVAANDPFGELFGRGGDALVGESLSSLLPSVTREAVASAADGDEPLTARCAGETDRWVELTVERHRSDGQTRFLAVGHEVTAHRERERDLDRHRRLVEAMGDGVYTLDESLAVETVDDTVTALTGRDRADLVGSDAGALLDDSTAERAGKLRERLLDGDREDVTLTGELEAADGERRPVETRFSTFERDDGARRTVGVVRDVSDRRQFARTLEALQQSTRRLLHAETADEVATIIAETASDVLDAPGATVYLFDRGENVLRPAAVADASATDDSPTTVGPDGGLVWDVFVDDEGVTLGTGETYRPLDDQGVLSVRSPTADRNGRTRELVDLLADTARAALARVDRETVLREREAERRHRNEELRRLKQVNAVIRRVDRALVEAETREEIERAVCDELTASHWITFAWLGRCENASVEPRTWDGRSEGFLETVSTSAVGDGGTPAVRTARSGEPTVVPAIADNLRDEHWRTEAISRNFQSAISVPLKHDDFRYGVLTVYADQSDRFGETLRSVFVELGENIANAIREVESRKRRLTDSVVELDLSLAAPDCLPVQLAREFDRSVICSGVVPSGDRTRLFLRIPDRDPTAVREYVDGVPNVESVSSVSDDGDYEVVVDGPTVPRTVVEQGARLGGLEATATGVDLVVHLSAETNVRTFVEQLSSRYADVELDARREKPTRHRTKSGTRADLEERLTDRQLEVLRTAYLSGFFEWPRETTGEEVASMLDITQPTVNRHLRVSQRKLLDLVFGE